MQDRVLTRIALCIATLPLSAAAADAENDLQAMMVVDASVGAWSELDDGSSALVGVRIAISELVASMAVEDDVHLGLRFIGSDVPFSDAGACQDSRLALPTLPLDRDGLVAAFDDTLPTGSRPLIHGLVRAAADLDDSATRRRIILVTSGEDNCYGDRSDAARALAGGVELRVVGLKLEEAALGRFSGVAPTRNAKDTRQLLTALRWALFDDEGATNDRVTASLRVVPEAELPGGARLMLRSVVEDTTVKLDARGDGFEGSVRPGWYSVQSTVKGDMLFEAGPMSLTAETTGSYTLNVGATPPVTLEVNPASPVAGDEVYVQFWGAPAGRHWLTVAPAGKPLDAWVARSATTDGKAEARLRLPAEPQALEIRFIERRPDALDRVIGRLELESEAPRATLNLPESAIVDTKLMVEWRGPDLRGDHLNLTPEGINPALHSACAFTSRGSPIALSAPSRTGTYVMRYISGVSGRVVAAETVEIVPTPIGLTLPDQVSARREFAVSWTGSTLEGDYVLLTGLEAAEGEYLLLRPTSSSPQVTFEAPAVVGQYEIRYVDGKTGHIRAQQAFEVIAVAAALDAPDTVRAGTRFKVNWTGPDAPGDLITVAPPNSGWNGRLDWVHTSIGTPADLAAPFTPGAYEIRYISPQDRKILARVPIEVE